MSVEPTYDRYYQRAPQLQDAAGPTWITRGAHFVVTVTSVQAGSRLLRSAQPDEYMVYLPDVAALIRTGSQDVQASPDSLTIVPPGDSEVIAAGTGHVVRVFTSQAADLAAQAGNAATYATGARGVAPFVAWPDPPAGFKLRHYRGADYDNPDSNMRLFRCTGLMINLLKRRDVPRDLTRLSPHTHRDFEQGSLAVQGTYVHHLRWPWTRDMNDWRADAHEEMASPSLLVVPPGVIHTSRNVTAPGQLVDIFAPPRPDFSARPGLVCNADEYPLPPWVHMSAHASGTAA